MTFDVGVRSCFNTNRHRLLLKNWSPLSNELLRCPASPEPPSGHAKLAEVLLSREGRLDIVEVYAILCTNPQPCVTVIHGPFATLGDLPVAVTLPDLLPSLLVHPHQSSHPVVINLPSSAMWQYPIRYGLVVEFLQALGFGSSSPHVPSPGPGQPLNLVVAASFFRVFFCFGQLDTRSTIKDHHVYCLGDPGHLVDLQIGLQKERCACQNTRFNPSIIWEPYQSF
ncbi:hypothetical protein EDC04DRAFT_889534 [Pisolithus marmoratus]|nr:hypothetical protein EDC04DRAFT_889534 [Pisolithus marmoratus]